MQFLDWGGKDVPFGFKWNHVDGRVKDLWYVGTCGCIIDEGRKPWMDANGIWRPTNPDGDHRGYHLWTGMSLDLNASWRSIAQEWLDAQIDPINKVQPFVNLRLGRTYRASLGREVKTSKFLERLEFYGAEVPDGVQYLTIGGDVQSGENARIEAAVWGWGRGLEAWLIGHFVIPGDPAEREVWACLDDLIRREFTKADGTTLRVKASCIDSGGHYTAETYAFCNERRARRVWAIKGRSEVMGRRSPVWPRKPSKTLGNVWYMIGGNAARDFAYGGLHLEKAGPRFVHFPDEPAKGSREIDEEFFEQLTRETLVTRKQGFTEWDKPKRPREAGVCFVYAYAAVCGLQALSGRFVALGKVTDEPPVSPEPQPIAGASAQAQPASPPRHQPTLNVTQQKPAAPKRQQDWLPKKRRSSWL